MSDLPTILPPGPVAVLNSAWDSAPPPPEFASFVVSDSEMSEESLLELLAVDAARRWQFGLDASLIYYRAILPERLLTRKVITAIEQHQFRHRDYLQRTVSSAGATMLVEKTAAPEPAPRRDLTTEAPPIEKPGTVMYPPPAVERYEFKQHIKSGGFGEVWRAVDRTLDRELAIKIIWLPKGRDETRVRDAFLREAKLAARLEHPNVARVYDFGQRERMCFMAMEWVRGVRIDQFATENRLSEQQILRLFCTVCDAVEHAHRPTDSSRAPIIHRDLKPDNILVTPDGQPHVLDFGLARELKPTDPAKSRSELAGTVPFMSPEQADGRVADLQTTSDVYSLGVILYVLLLRRFPHEFTGKRLQDLEIIITKPITKPRTVDPRIPEDLEAVLLWALDKEPMKRPQSAGEMAVLLRRYLPRARGADDSGLLQVADETTRATAASSPTTMPPGTDHFVSQFPDASDGADDDGSDGSAGSIGSSFRTSSGTIERHDQIGPWLVLKVISQRGTSVVYEARHEVTGVAGALKFVKPGITPPQIVDRFTREFRMVSRLNHPNIIKLIDAGTANFNEAKIPFFVLERLHGKPIDRYLDSRAATPRQRAEFFVTVCNAIAHLHDQSIIKRDIRPASIIVTEKRDVKLVDFSAARPFGTSKDYDELTETDQLIGTLPYMSPEQASGQSRLLDARSDVYALGVVLYELLTGQLPYDVASRTILDALRVIRETRPPRIASIKPTLRGDLDWIVEKALSKEPEDRYQSAREIEADLKRFLMHLPVGAVPRSRAYLLKKGLMRHRRTLIIAGVALFILVSLIVMLSR